MNIKDNNTDQCLIAVCDAEEFNSLSMLMANLYNREMGMTFDEVRSLAKSIEVRLARFHLVTLAELKAQS